MRLTATLIGLFAEKVVLSEGVESIAARAFADSMNLRLITLPDKPMRRYMKAPM